MPSFRWPGLKRGREAARETVAPVARAGTDSTRGPCRVGVLVSGPVPVVASSVGIRELIWRPGSVVAPLLGGWLMDEVSTASVCYVGDAFALTGVCSFLAILARLHGPAALTEW